MRWGVVDRSNDATPMEQMRYAPENAILGNEGTVGSPTEYGVDGCMVIKVKVNGQLSTEGSKGEGPIGGKEFRSLLGEDPRRAGKEPGAHGELPNADVEGPPG